MVRSRLAVESCEILLKDRFKVNVDSMPSFELFEQQHDSYKKEVFPNESIVIGIEAGIQQCWDKYIGKTGKFIGMSSYGASAPAEHLYKKYGITTENIVFQSRKVLGGRPS